MTVESLLGFARASGSLLAGDTACRQGLARGKARAIVLATDASAKKRRSFGELARRAGVPVFEWGTTGSLSAAVGYAGPLAVAVITGESFVSALRPLLAPADLSRPGDLAPGRDGGGRR